MARNSHAVEHALTRGLRSVRREVSDTGNGVLRKFKEAVSAAYPPASTPGAPPHRRTGEYAQSLSVRSSGDQIVIFTKGSGNKAVWLEFGTRKMAARPHWRTRLPRIAADVVPRRIGAALVKGEIR